MSLICAWLELPGGGGRSNVLALAGSEMMLSRDHGRDARDRRGMTVSVMSLSHEAELGLALRGMVCTTRLVLAICGDRSDP